jgi:hypothetical protein
VFASGWCAEAAAFAPAAIAGTLQQLLELGVNDPPALTHALIVLHRPGEAFAGGADRERLWRAFHVPVFEQIIGDQGVLLASECEAHDGLHIDVAGLDCTPYSVETSLCACGRKSPRLSHAETAERTRAAAVYAR